MEGKHTELMSSKSIHLDKALEMVGFGKCQYYLLFVCGWTLGGAAVSLTTGSFILPSAQCDFQMTSVYKGFLNGASMVGMFLGSFVWGYVADSKGRRYALICCTMMDGVFSLMSSVSQIYPVLIFCKVMSGFGVVGCTVVYLYLGEFLSTKYREKYMCWVEFFWICGIIILPCIAWIIIPLTFRIEFGFFLFRSWNLFTIVCALFSIMSMCLLINLPETPKFLLAKGKHDETVDCLKFMYRWNNKSDEKFPTTFVISPDNAVINSSKGFFGEFYHSTVGLFSSKYKLTAMITFIIQFCSNASYYMMTLWFPELLNRFRLYETTYTGHDIQTMCDVVSMYRTKAEEMVVECNDHIEKSVYLNIIIIGMGCLPTSIIVPLFVDKVGIRFFTVSSFISAGMSAACLYFITSSTQNIVIASVFEALSSMGMNLINCMVVGLFPTEHRGMAMSMGSVFGKLGAVTGNLIVGVFIDAYCMIPILVACSFSIIAGLLTLILPKTGVTDQR